MPTAVEPRGPIHRYPLTPGTLAQAGLAFAPGLAFVGGNAARSVMGLPACFAPGTQVVTAVNPDGTYVTRNIEDIQLGDLVLTQDEANPDAEPVLRHVLEVQEHTTDHLRILEIQDRVTGNVETIVTTDEHPFYADGIGWLGAGDLRAGQALGEAGEADLVVLSSRYEAHPQGLTVYNLEIDGGHTYFVADADGAMTPAWVHNACQAGDAGKFSTLQSRGNPFDGLTPHHMPQAAQKFTSRAEGGALMLPDAIHRLTRTYRNAGKLTLAAEKGMGFRQVLARDIRDVRKLTGSQFNEGLLSLINYYRTHFPDLL